MTDQDAHVNKAFDNQLRYNSNMLIVLFLVPIFILLVLLPQMIAATEYELKIRAKVMSSTLIICGSVFLLLGIRLKKKMKRFRSCASFMQPGGTYTVEQVAQELNLPVDKAFKLMEELEKYFVEGSLDKERRCFEIAGPSKYEFDSPSASSDGKTVNVVCRSCGASKSVREGESRECDYCGSPIHAPTSL